MTVMGETIHTSSMPQVILETDMTFDVDDVGALAVLHALADQGEAEILGVSYNEVHNHGVGAIATINAWYGRPNLPIAATTNKLVEPDASRYLERVAQLLQDKEASKSLEVIEFYDELLGSSPANAVTIVSVGFLNNLAELLRLRPNLIEERVKELVVMGGLVNDNFNLVRHELVDDSEYVIREWPTPLIVTDYGGRLMTGASLQHGPENNPVAQAYFHWFNGAWRGRSSWDQIAVLVAVRGESWHFEFLGKGKGRLRNGYEWSLDGNFRTYARPSLDEPEIYRAEIEALMTASPNLQP